MKRIRIFALVLCFAVLLGLFSGCQDKYADADKKYPLPEKLSKETVKQIQEDYAVFYSEYIHDVYTGVRFICLGTYNGAIAMYYDSMGGDDMVQDRTIAGYSYKMPDSGAYIHIYKDGEFIKGDEAYEQGIITEQDAETIVWLWNNLSEWRPKDKNKTWVD